MTISETKSFTITAKKKSSYTEIIDLKNRIRKYCLEEGLNEYLFNRIKGRVHNKAVTLNFVTTVVEKYKEIFESLGYGPEDVTEYINTFPCTVEMEKTALKYNFALLDYAGMLETSLFQRPSLIYSFQNPNELFAIIKWLKDSKDENNKISPIELEYYLEKLTNEEKKSLKEKYPFSKSKASLVLLRHENLTQGRLKENLNYVKSLK